MKTRPVLAVETSDNMKLGPVSATYVSQASCPPGCPFYENGCYAEYGPVGFMTARLNDSKVRSPLAVARAEAEAVGGLTGDRPLRLHVVGDCRTRGAAKILAEAAEKYTAKRRSPVWTYTHAWRDIDREDWGKISVLASCESTEQAEDAMYLGYAVALVVDRFESDSQYHLDGLRVIPCPYQTRGTQCRDCRLCWRDQTLHAERMVIAFEAHGSGASRVRTALPVINNPNRQEAA